MLGDGFPIMDHASVVLAGIVAVLETGGTGRVRCTLEEGGINANKAREIGVGGGGGFGQRCAQLGLIGHSSARA